MTPENHPPNTAAPPAASHPQALTALDEAYLAPWGRRQIGVALAAGLPLVVGLGALSVVSTPLWSLGLGAVLALLGFFILFFRNPRRLVPQAPGLLVAPADGTVWDIEDVEAPEFVGEPCVRIGIFLSIFNVHVNRSPASGRVAYTAHTEGAFHDARAQLASERNEANAIGLLREDAGGPPAVKLLVRQISGAIARRIVCPLEGGERLRRGGLIGMIKYGSRTELFVPRSSGVEVRVKVGQKVLGGETVLASWEPRDG